MGISHILGLTSFFFLFVCVCVLGIYKVNLNFVAFEESFNFTGKSSIDSY